MCNFRFIQISAKISPSKSKTAIFNGFFWSEYILKTDAGLNYFSASSYAKFVGFHEHPEALTVVYGLTYSFYKKQVFTARVRTVQMILYKLKFNTKFGRYPAMPFIVVRFKERKLQRRFWNCVRPYDGCFSKTGEIEI